MALSKRCSSPKVLFHIMVLLSRAGWYQYMTNHKCNKFITYSHVS